MGKPIADNRQPCVELPRSTKGPGVDAAGAATLLAVACLHDKVTQGSRRRAQLNPLSNWVHEAKSVCDIMPEIRLETMPENRHKPVTEIQRGVSSLYQTSQENLHESAAKPCPKLGSVSRRKIDTESGRETDDP